MKLFTDTDKINAILDETVCNVHLIMSFASDGHNF